MIIYRIFVKVNYKDTMRDADDIQITELGYKSESKLDEAKVIAENFIRDKFFHTNTKLTENNDGSFSATDFCSWGATIKIQPITVD